MRCFSIRDLTYQILLVGLGIIAKSRGPEFFIASGWCFILEGVLRGSFPPPPPPYVHHICWGNLRVLFRKPPCLVLVGFSSNWTQHFCLHLQNCLPRRHYNGLDCGWAPCVPFALVRATPLWFRNTPSIQKRFLGRFPLRWYRSSFVFEFRASWDKRSGRNNGVTVLTRWP